LACGLLLLITLLVYASVVSHDFVNYDDPEYVTGNSQVQAGLSLDGLMWALTTTAAHNWHPLTWLSHMLDWELFGSWAGGHHLTSVLLHLASTALLFVFLSRTTNAPGRSAFVAGLFALHPLHVESVAWVAERKDVLSGFFFMLTLVAYARYVERPGWKGYALVILSFALGLMAKPMLVTLPFLLLLLDLWPLQRASVPLKSRLLEKVPLLVLAIVSGGVTLFVQQQGGAMQTLGELPLGSRAANAVVAYFSYLGKMWWPADLAAFYPRTVRTGWQWAGALALIGAISVFVMGIVRRHSYALVGWCWYLGMLVPVIGLVQVGDQAMADRYTYLPLIGVWIAVSWGALAIAERLRLPEKALPAAAALILAACAAVTWLQIGHWKNSAALFQHALRVTKDNYIAHINYGVVLFSAGRVDEAMDHYRAALRIKPDSVDARHNLGLALLVKGQTDDAIAQYQEALRIKPAFGEAHANLGHALIRQQRIPEAIHQYRLALETMPDDIESHYNLGVALLEEGQAPAAREHFAAVVRLQPDRAEAHNNLGFTLLDAGDIEEAVREYREALRLRPGLPEALCNLVEALLIQGKIEEAREQQRLLLPSHPELAAEMEKRIEHYRATKQGIGQP
jgi:Flp pilus assembly protein TadD